MSLTWSRCVGMSRDVLRVLEAFCVCPVVWKSFLMFTLGWETRNSQSCINAEQMTNRKFEDICYSWPKLEFPRLGFEEIIIAMTVLNELNNDLHC